MILMNVKKYSRWVLLLLILLASGKAIMFTMDVALASYFLQGNKEKAAAHMYRILCDKPIVYLSFRDTQKTLVGDFIVKKAISARYRDNKNIFDIFPPAPGLKELTLERFKALYRDNFYFQYLFPPVPSQPNWKNLDAVSLELLADKTLNPLTLSLWEKVKPAADPDFAANLADYCRWQGNTELGDYLGKDAVAAAKPFFNPDVPTGNESFKRLLEVLWKKNKLTGGDFKEVRADSENFNNMETFKKKWEFSNMAGGKFFNRASFTMGLDGDGENRCLRLTGFFVGSGDEKTKSSARGGAFCKEIVSLPGGYYFLSFDYLTGTGREKPSLYLWEGLSEIFLPPTDGRWKKAVYFFDNSTGNHGMIKPFFRMWGTGTVLIDNVYFAVITKPTFTLSRTALRYIHEWK
jgi:hypothetical protein